MTMGMYELVAELRVRESLRLTNDTDRLREGIGRRLNAVAIGEAIHLLERAADFYSQASRMGHLLSMTSSLFLPMNSLLDFTDKLPVAVVNTSLE